ncbi:hypothetical protein [Raineyella fluvialis]|uniref:DUF4352 domain-containing protein n=1 Tax=Raineyella fluvialis TaxID=2662261 RepID=A0A5Q2FD55_9ACTN|nr:hypothetical protein [Raineyella fluvialis]QGF24311.1 hypothetical protein Rai3103_12290 [Raineyella fluvialis]
MAIRDGSSVRTYLTGAVLIALVIVAAVIGSRLDRSSSIPSRAPTTQSAAGPATTAGPSAGAVPRGPFPAATPSATGLPSSGRWIDYQSSEGTGRLAVTGHRRNGRLTELDVTLAATSGYQSYDLLAYDDDGYRYLPEAGRGSGAGLESGVLAAGETVSGRLSFAAPSGALTLVLRNDRDESVAALRID